MGRGKNQMQRKKRRPQHEQRKHQTRSISGATHFLIDWPHVTQNISAKSKSQSI
jgi:hypothetical protein